MKEVVNGAYEEGRTEPPSEVNNFPMREEGSLTENEKTKMNYNLNLLLQTFYLYL